MRSRRNRRTRRGTTLIEIAMVVVVVGIVTALGFPRMASFLDQANTSGAKTLVAELVSKARFAAVTRSGPASLTITPDGHVWVMAPKVGSPGVQDTVGKIENLGGRYGVTLTAPTATTTVGFDAQGVGTNAGTTLVIFTRNSDVDTLSISASGRTSP